MEMKNIVANDIVSYTEQLVSLVKDGYTVSYNYGEAPCNAIVYTAWLYKEEKPAEVEAVVGEMLEKIAKPVGRPAKAGAK